MRLPAIFTAVVHFSGHGSHRLQWEIFLEYSAVLVKVTLSKLTKFQTLLLHFSGFPAPHVYMYVRINAS